MTKVKERNPSEVLFTDIFPGDGWEFPNDFSLDIAGILPNRIGINRRHDVLVMVCPQSMSGPDYHISCDGLRWMNEQVSAKAYRDLQVALTQDGLRVLINSRRAADLAWDLRTIPPNPGKALRSGASRQNFSAAHQGYGACWLVSENFIPVGPRQQYGWKR
jgi:hypothetical protein